MLISLAPGWTIVLDHGPDWLFVRLQSDRADHSDRLEFADRVWQLMQQEFTNRVVVELDGLRVLTSLLVGELVSLHNRVDANEGLLRVSGLSDANQEVLRTLRAGDRFPQYGSREDAVMGHRPSKPR